MMMMMIMMKRPQENVSFRTEELMMSFAHKNLHSPLNKVGVTCGVVRDIRFHNFKVFSRDYW